MTTTHPQSPAQARSRLESLTGTVERLLYIGANGFTAARMGLSDGHSLTAKGQALHGVQPGETPQLRGHHVNHPTYGSEFRAVDCHHVEPATPHALRTYLSSGLVRGIGPRLAEAIVEHFGLDTLAVIDTTPERLLDVPQIGPGRHREIVTAWQTHQEVRQLMILLQSAGISSTHAPRIVRHFHTEPHDAHDVTGVLEIIRTTPYRLTEVYGIGFTTADRLALWLGAPERSPQRLQAALLHTLEAAAGVGGHSFLWERQLYARTAKNLQDPTLGQLLPAELATLVAGRRVVMQDLPRDGQTCPAVFTP
ncbi:helix-hairpin-helix domain-containing protein [Kitasatospora sp. NPDC051853]|uniref:helix-hairpin-helix domain-containing protein n=1 Tax=Kitasatospora sp. NPDC051853 TaxID=3364058 RepID=UPI0037B381F6